MAGVCSRPLLNPQPPGWVWPVLVTTASVVFAGVLLKTLRFMGGFASAHESSFHPPQAVLVLGGDRRRELLAARFAAACGDPAVCRHVAPAAHATGVRLLPIYVSSGHDDVAEVMRQAGVDPGRLTVDERALDTVTNFTSMLPTFKCAKYSHVYVVTSDYHVPRARMLASLILCSHGIAFTIVSLPSSTSASASAASARSADALRIQRGETRSRSGDRQGESQARAQGSSNSRTAVVQHSGTPGNEISLKPTEGDGGYESVEAETRIRRERDRVRALLWLALGWHGAELLRFTRPNRYREQKLRLRKAMEGKSE